MAAPRAGESAAGGLAAAAAPLSRFVDACLVALLAAIPLIAPAADRPSAVMMAGAAALGAWSLHKKVSRAQRVSRCAWTVFLASAVAIHLGERALDPGTGAAGIPERAALVARLSALLAIAGRGMAFGWERRRPRFVDAHDWAAAACLGVLALAACAFVSVGAARGARALAEPGAIVAMFLVTRGRCDTTVGARRLARLATGAVILALVVWGVTR